MSSRPGEVLFPTLCVLKALGLSPVPQVTWGRGSLQGAEIVLLLGQRLERPSPPHSPKPCPSKGREMSSQVMLLPVTQTTLNSSGSSCNAGRVTLEPADEWPYIVTALGHIRAYRHLPARGRFSSSMVTGKRKFGGQDFPLPGPGFWTLSV